MSELDREAILDLLERRALRMSAEEVEEPEFDLSDVISPGGGEPALPDLTLGGYIAEHDRPPAFEGSDGQPYTVAGEVEETEDPDRPYAAFFLFLRWAATGAGIMEHFESGDVAYGATEREAHLAALELTLYEIKAELDAAIARRRAEMED